MKKRVLLTPIDLSRPATRRGGTFEKQILPLGSINYKGRKITFDRKYLTDLAVSFKERAYDQVAVIHATETNQHNLDPRNFGGDVISLSVKADGLYAKIRPDSDTARLLGKNPNLGVSARIVEGLEKADGRVFPRAIQHVLLTMDPQVTGMKPWRTVDLSVYNGSTRRVVDLTALTIEKESEMPKIKGPTSRVKAKAKTQEPKQQAQPGFLDLSTLTDEDLDALLDLATPADAPRPKSTKKVTEETTFEDEVDEDAEVDEDEDDVEDVDPDDIDDEDLDEEVVEEEPDDDADESDLSEDQPPAGNLATALAAEKQRRKAAAPKQKVAKRATDLSARNDRRRQIDLAAGASVSTDHDALSAMREEIAVERWEARRKAYTQAGVPPFLLDLAAPLLSTPDAVVIDLSTSDEPVNATQVVADVLDGVKGMIDLRPEIGHAVDLSQDQEQTSEVASLLDAWENERF